MVKQAQLIRRVIAAVTSRSETQSLGNRQRRRYRAEVAIRMGTKILPEALLLVGSVYVFFAAGRFDYAPRADDLGPAFWPRMISAALIFLASARMFGKITNRGGPVRQQPTHHEGESLEDAEPLDVRLAGLGILLVVSYAASVTFLGYMAATFLFLFLFLSVSGRTKWFAAAWSLVVTTLFAYIFLNVVYVSLPTGVGVFDSLSVAIYRALGIY